MSPELARRLRTSSVEVRSGNTGGGSGVIWSPDGLIVTNAHVASTREVGVRLSDKRQFSAEILRRNTDRDLALLRIPAKNLPAAEIGDSNAIRPGQIVAAIGNPLGIIGAVTTGVIFSANPGRWIEADVKLAPGNSGGMLADVRGRVLGINTMIYAGLALAIPADDVIDFVEGEERRPMLGVTMRPVHVDQQPALMLLEVERGGLADRNGLLMGDVLLVSERQFRSDLRRGGVMQLRFLRANRMKQVEISIPVSRGVQGRAA